MDWVPDLRQLRAFVAVAEEGSFTLAARRIFVTQSAVSHSLRTLEDQLSCRLLDRSGKRVVVTSEGEILLRRCRRVLHELDQAGRDLDGLRRWGQTRIRIGAPEFEAMKESALLINTARGGIVDVPALVAAIEGGRIGGAGIDVLPAEPPRADDAIVAAYRNLEGSRLDGRLIMTPHSAWSSPESAADARRLAVETAVMYLREGRLRNLVNGDFLTNPRG